jgi:hypothetical protein
MDTSQTLMSAGISIGSYIIYKLIQRYWIKSACHDSTIEITIVDKEATTTQQVEQVSQCIQKNSIPPNSEC